MATHSIPFPALTTIAWQVAIFFVFEDTFHVRTRLCGCRSRGNHLLTLARPACSSTLLTAGSTPR